MQFIFTAGFQFRQCYALQVYTALLVLQWSLRFVPSRSNISPEGVHRAVEDDAWARRKMSNPKKHKQLMRATATAQFVSRGTSAAHEGFDAR